MNMGNYLAGGLLGAGIITFAAEPFGISNVVKDSVTGNYSVAVTNAAPGSVYRVQVSSDLSKTDGWHTINTVSNLISNSFTNQISQRRLEEVLPQRNIYFFRAVKD